MAGRGGVVGVVEAYEKLVVAHAPALLRLAVMLTGQRQDAEDLLQSTLLKVQRHRGRLVEMGAPGAYLRRVMVNEHLSAGRTRMRRVATVSAEAAPEPASEDATGFLDQRDELWRRLATVPKQQRAVLVLRYYEDLPDAEIAQVLGISEGTVRSNAFRGLAALRAQLATSSEVTS